MIFLLYVYSHLLCIKRSLSPSQNDYPVQVTDKIRIAKIAKWRALLCKNHKRKCLNMYKIKNILSDQR